MRTTSTFCSFNNKKCLLISWIILILTSYFNCICFCTVREGNKGKIRCTNAWNKMFEVYKWLENVEHKQAYILNFRKRLKTFRKCWNDFGLRWTTTRRRRSLSTCCPASSAASSCPPRLRRPSDSASSRASVCRGRAIRPPSKSGEEWLTF